MHSAVSDLEILSDGMASIIIAAEHVCSIEICAARLAIDPVSTVSIP
jgi:hypothetical protein